MIATTIATFNFQEAQRFANEFSELFSLGDYAAMASFYTDDAKLMMDDMEIIQGRAAIEQFWQKSCRMSGMMKHITTVREVGTAGDLGYTVGVITLQVQISADQVITNTCKYATIWKRASNGVWQLDVDIVNRDAPLAIPQEWSSASIQDFLQGEAANASVNN